MLSELNGHPAVFGAFVLSTCNRTEICGHVLPGSFRIPLEILFKVKKMPLSPELEQHFYFHSGQAAVRHVFSVAAGLDSLVLGEKQILGQVKEAAQLARDHKLLTRELNILTHLAVRAGKKAQSETEIGCGGSSVSWAAVATAQERLGSLAARSILVIGAGKMGHMAAEQLRSRSVGKVYVMNRTCDKAQSVADTIDGEFVPFWEMKDILQKVDVCICSAGAPHYLIERDLVKEVMRARCGRPLLLIDISMPRNIDPEVKTVPGVELFTIDELDQVVEDNVRRRQNAVGIVERIIDQKVSEFYDKLTRAQEAAKSALG